MRIRRNHWLLCTLAAALPMFAATSAQGQVTSGTAEAQPTTASSALGSSAFGIEPGDQLQYRTQGELQIIGGGQQQKEDMDILTSVTVLEKNSDSLTLYASLSASEETSTGVVYQTGPRYTFELPLEGADPQQELEKAGLVGAAFPTFSMENIFGKVPQEGKTSITISLPITNAPAQGEAVTTREGANLVTVATASEESTPVLSRKSTFNSQKKLVDTIETSVTLAVNAQGVPVTFSISDTTRLTNQIKLPDDQFQALKKDISAAVPVATKLKNLQMSTPAVMAEVIAEMRKNLEEHPTGEFSSIFAELQNQIDTGGGDQRGPNAVNLKIGQPIPDFDTTTVDGKPFKLSDLKGKVILLDFWATWCPPCILQLPHMKQLYERNKDKNFVLVGISADETAEDLKNFLENENMQWPQIFDGSDTTSTIAEQYGVFIRPTTVLIDAKGNVSAIDVYGKRLDEAVDKLLESAK